MSNYEERMSKKYNFFSNDKDVNDTSANEPEVSSETTSNMDIDCLLYTSPSPRDRG